MWDGFSLCDDTRTMQNGTAYANDLGTMPHSYSTYWDLRDKITHGQISHRGLLVRDEPAVLVTHDSNERDYLKILSQPYEPDSIHRNKNFLQSRAPKVVYCPYMETTDAILFGKKALKNMIYWIVKPPTRTEDDHPRNRGFSMFMHMRILFGPLDFKSVVGKQ
jgi:hypothetical protein